MEASSLRSVSMSRTWGMFSSVTSSSVRMAAAMQGRAEFLAPETRMVPTRGLPPRITNLSIEQKTPWSGPGIIVCECGNGGLQVYVWMQVATSALKRIHGGTLPAFKCKCDAAVNGGGSRGSVEKGHSLWG